jgi:O-Antigen ligase
VDAPLRRLLSSPPAGVDLRAPAVLRRPLLIAGGLGCGISPAFFGYFDIAVWGPIGIVLAALAVTLLVARQAVPRGLAAFAVVAVLAFGVWCLLSIGWAESGDRALVEGDRWIVYGLFLLNAILLLDDRTDATLLLAAIGAGVVGVAAYDLVRMLGGQGSDLFSGTRLVEPLGYVNGLGGFFLFGFWLLLAVAERCRRALLAGAAAGGAAALAALVVLTDSRGTAFAFAVAAAVLVALVPGRNRRVWALVAILAAVAVAWGPLTDVTRTLPDPTATPPDHLIKHAAEVMLIAAAGVGVVWGLVVWATGALVREPADRARAAKVSAGALLAGALVALVIGLAAVGNPFGRVSDQYDAFTALEPVKGASRFTSGGGNRYDYWRIAWNQFTAHPLDGIGAGNFDRTYYLERRTNEDVRQAHSIELGTLGDTGLVGGLLLGGFLVAVFVGIWRGAAFCRRDPAEIGVTVAAGGAFLVWLAQTSVDWLHLIPGLAGIALAAAAILLRRPRTVDGDRSLVGFPAPFLPLAIAVAVAVVVVVGRPALAESLRSDASADLEGEPVAALTSADESLSLNSESIQGYYLKSAALARLHLFEPAKAALLEAIAKEPHNYVSWALLGDLLTRRGDFTGARRAYGHASELNPRDPGLRTLASREKLLRHLNQDPAGVTDLSQP